MLQRRDMGHAGHSWLPVIVALIALLFSVGEVQRWECSMSGVRACPCACSTHGEEHDDGPAARREACCEAQPMADSAPATVEMIARAQVIGAPPSMDDARESTVVAPNLPASCRGPPPPTVPRYITHRSLLL